VSLTLAVETSSPAYAAAIGTPGRVLVHRSVRREESSFQGLGDLVASSLAEIGAGFADVGQLAVDVGPGSLSSVRAAVAYVNGLAFSLDLMIFCASSLELLAAAVPDRDGEPVLCVRNAGAGNVYAGLFGRGTTPSLRYGPLEPAVKSLAGELARVSVAGALREQVAGALGGAQVRDTGVEFPDVLTLLELAGRGGPAEGGTGPDRPLVPLAIPLTEASAVFRG
jgi:tRNA threonylcarbamoyl adenosine modification protein YeaZ